MSSDSINPTSISSQSSENILMLMNVLYTPGFPLHALTLPLLNGRTMHALYAISFVIYSFTNLCDWIFVYFTLRGYITSFPLKTWLAIALVSTTVFGSMLTSLLLVLCIENAFAHRLDIVPYRSGFAIIYEAFIQWVQAFNNFRITFLFMILHDMPLTIMNFIFITSCQCIGPQIFQLPLIISSLATTISILWRLVMLYFAYRRMIFPLKPLSHDDTYIRQPTICEQLKLNLSQKNCGRLNDYDELWPIRYSVRKIYLPVVEGNHEQQNVPVKFNEQLHGNALLKICVAISSSQKTIQTSIETNSKEYLSTSELQYICKPIWEDGGFKIGLNRQEAGIWQTRITLTEKQILAISTKVEMEYENDRQNPYHTLYYDYVLLQHNDALPQSTCIPGNKTDWKFINEINELAWPYYAACDRTWSIKWITLIDCSLYNNHDNLENKNSYFDYVLF
ncbi:unnamed protein product [Cercopithifilaria johnstoni]|uniref:Transmembrane protein n=1 Tax=Cercopithifilaria johnstoni TaxID=2874296 RepID=A0A8J2MP87_9BILA|nr:unnamed protein product [Cercopithifilaria johnstoni]